MTVKAWGNGGNAGAPFEPVVGNGGGGGYVTASYNNVPAGQTFYAKVVPQPTNVSQYPGKAVVLHKGDTAQGRIVLVAAGGGGGSSSKDNVGPAPNGGAGGAVGQAGKDGFVVHGTVMMTIGGGGGGSAGGPGAGGIGLLSVNGAEGGYYPCEPQPLNPPICGWGGSPLGGHGGEGAWGGGGGGGDGHPQPRGGAGGGGGGCFVNPLANGLFYSAIADGVDQTPGNAADPERQGAGQGGSAGLAGMTGAKGRMIIKFNSVEIDPQATTRLASVGADKPIDIVFDSPADLDLGSARLEITDATGDTVAVHDQRLELLSSGLNKAYRYRLSSKGPWAGLTAGDYRVTVRASDHSGVVLSSQTENRIRLVEPSGSDSKR